MVFIPISEEVPPTCDCGAILTYKEKQCTKCRIQEYKNNVAKDNLDNEATLVEGLKLAKKHQSDTGDFLLMNPTQESLALYQKAVEAFNAANAAYLAIIHTRNADHLAKLASLYPKWFDNVMAKTGRTEEESTIKRIKARATRATGFTPSHTDSDARYSC